MSCLEVAQAVRHVTVHALPTRGRGGGGVAELGAATTRGTAMMQTGSDRYQFEWQVLLHAGHFSQKSP